MAQTATHPTPRKPRRALAYAKYACLSLATACATSGQTAAVRPYVAATEAHQPADDDDATARHGFDPRAYYNKRAIATQRGAASYYADRFAGRLTANGERYDPNAYTAAHRSLPFGSIVRVVYEKTGDWVLVRINDRGPYGPKGRVIDLSRKAATRLSMLKEGVVRVRLELLERGSGKRVKHRPAK